MLYSCGGARSSCGELGLRASAAMASEASSLAFRLNLLVVVSLIHPTSFYLTCNCPEEEDMTLLWPVQGLRLTSLWNHCNLVSRFGGIGLRVLCYKRYHSTTMCIWGFLRKRTCSRFKVSLGLRSLSPVFCGLRDWDLGLYAMREIMQRRSVCEVFSWWSWKLSWSHFWG